MSKMLSSWKEIAHFFGKGVRTVQRWEKTLDLPIHRPPGAPSNVVLARTSDLEEWMHRGPATRALEAAPDEAESPIQLDALEHEVKLLAHVTGVAVIKPSTTTQHERATALAETVRAVHSKLTAPGAAKAA